jgi:hypothetical protein
MTDCENEVAVIVAHHGDYSGDLEFYDPQTGDVILKIEYDQIEKLVLDKMKEDLIARIEETENIVKERLGLI